MPTPILSPTIPSEEVTLVDKEEDILSQISPLFHVSETKYGGKGCFSYGTIPENTDILISKPLGYTISKDFKKEVCHQCFKYNGGENMKERLTLPSFKNQSLYFCSEQCLSLFKDLEEYDVYLWSLLNLDKMYDSFKTDEAGDIPSAGDEEFIRTIKSEWEKVETWNSEISRMKRTKWQKFIPKINEAEYLEIKYVLGVLHKLFLKDKYQESSGPEKKFLSDLNTTEGLLFEVELFEFLQSNEILKVLKYKNLLESYIRIFKFLKLTSPAEFDKFITPLNIRLIIGNNLTNAFGIWSLDEGDKEFFGFGVYPSGSFFNHSCEPNIVKKRINNELHYFTTRDIDKNDELCIDYGNYLDESVEIRRKQLSEWFFICGCQRCEREASN